MCCPLLSFFPVSAVIQRSACQLSKKTLRSMVITSPFDNLSTSSVLCRPFAFFYIWWDCFFSKTYESYAYSHELCKLSRTNVQAEGGLFGKIQTGLFSKDCKYSQVTFVFFHLFVYFFLFGLLCYCVLFCFSSWGTCFLQRVRFITLCCSVNC